jgi:asparagine synthase (glutamine-hydrolysing)
MNRIFGYLQRDSASVAPFTIETQRLMDEWTLDGGDVLRNGPAAIGQMMRRFSAPDTVYTRISLSDAESILFVAAGRVDNRQELIANCGSWVAGYEKSEIPDSEVIRLAYNKWGEDCPKRIYGDWSFAAWHPREHRLFLARDHFGNTSLYYYADQNKFAFASDRKTLLAMNLAPIKMDELYLAQVLVS